MIVAGTGHREIALPKGLLVNAIARKLHLLGAKGVISGMALGWDMALAEAALILELPLTAAVPFPAQPDLWPDDEKQRYERILARATSTVTLSEYTALSAYERRNRWMIDNADLVLAYWDGSLNGGTANAVRYAGRPKSQKPLVNMHGEIAL